LKDIVGTGSDEVGRGCNGKLKVLRKPGKSVGNAFFASCPYPSTVTAIEVKGRANVPAVDAVWCPGAAVGVLFMDKDTDTGRGNGHVIKIVGALDLGIQATRTLKEIQAEEGLR
jgi:hypothetical protein